MKKKKKLRHHLTRVIHPNRKLFWTVAFAMAAGIALFGYVFVSSFSFDYDSTFANSHLHPVYVDHVKQYSVEYPNGWQLEKDGLGNTIFDNPQNSGESVTISETAAKNVSAIKRSLSIKTESQYQRNGFDIDRISAGTKNGPDIDAAILVQNNRAYYISGRTQSFELFVNTLKLIQ